MPTVLKALLFAAFLYAMGLAGYRLYGLLNKKIEGSRTLGQLLFYSLLMIAANAGLFVGGLWAFLNLYEYLST